MNRNSSGGNRFDAYRKKYREYQNFLRKFGRIKEMIPAGNRDGILGGINEGMDAKANRAKIKLLRSKSVRSGVCLQHVKTLIMKWKRICT